MKGHVQAKAKPQPFPCGLWIAERGLTQRSQRTKRPFGTLNLESLGLTWDLGFGIWDLRALGLGLLLFFVCGSQARAGNEVVRGPVGKSRIALTFDAGAKADCFDDLIVTLDKARVHSTFFITGNWARENLRCAQSITKHGHEIGNHTWSHLDLTKQSDEKVSDEITRAETLLTTISGRSPQPRWRAPYGARNERVLNIAASLGYRSIYWTIDSLDSVDPPKTAPFIVQRITGKSDADLDGAIILMHVGERSTADALPVIIANLQARGFRLVTVSELLR